MKKLICILVILFAVLKFETVDEEELNCLLTGLI